MKTKQYTTEQEQIARFAKALGHPARMAILNFLVKQESCYFGDIHEELPIAKATVSQHLKELKDAGLIQGESSIALTVKTGNLPASCLPDSSVNVNVLRAVNKQHLFL